MYFATIFDSNSSEYGILLGAIPLTALVANLFWGYISKKPGKNLKQMRLIVFLECVAMSLIFINKGFEFMLFFVIFFSLFSSPSFNLQDCLAMNYAKLEKTSFQKIMFSGQIGAFLASFAGAGLLALTDENFIIIFLIALCLNVICYILWLFVKKIPDELIVDDKENSNVEISFKEVIKYKKFLIYFVVYLLVAGVNYVGNQYVFVRADLNGISATTLTTVSSIGGLMLLVSYYITLKLSKPQNYFTLMLVSLILLACRTLMLSLELSDFMLFIGIILGYMGWGVFIAMHLTFVGKLLPIHLLTKGVSLMMPCYYIISGTLTLTGPDIYSQTGLKEFFLILFSIQVIGCLIMVFFQDALEKEMVKDDIKTPESLE